MGWDRRRQFWAATSVRLGELAHSGRAPADIATLEELHALHAPRTWFEGSRCAECAQRWPCAVYRGIAAREGTDAPGSQVPGGDGLGGPPGGYPPGRRGCA
ncbi:hypothetical protein [Sinomonas sp.]|uniref:hypothetical protein n=1 Tax=Sinomonas sp. TaxID=1914986 RepID=UPI002FE40FED